MKFSQLIAISALVASGAATAQINFAEQSPATYVGERVSMELMVNAPNGLQPEAPVQMGVYLKFKPGWHGYWKNPGDAGQAPEIKWILPHEIAVGKLAWPAPMTFDVGELQSFGYAEAVLLSAPLKVKDLPVPEADGKVSFAAEVTAAVCNVTCELESATLYLNVHPSAPYIQHEGLFEQAMAKTPVAITPVKAQDGWRLPGVIGTLRSIYPEQGAPSAYKQQAYTAVDTPQGYVLQGDIPAVPLTIETSEGAWSVAAIPSTPASISVSIIVLAMLGGLLLNVMPCVFPVLALKMLSFSKGVGRPKRSAMAYTVGTLCTFIGLATLMLGLRAAGASIGWGFQMQSPGFIVFLILLFSVLVLSVMDKLPMTWLTSGKLANLRAKDPALDSFLTGILAVVVAAPCTVPFMGAAVGATLTMNTTQALAVFSAMALGLSSPILLAAWVPGAIKWLPRPGAWMHKFKKVMAAFLLATVAWLIFVLYGLIASNTSTQDYWKQWSPAKVQAELQAGSPVFVDFTARWCITCQYNKAVTLNTTEFKDTLKAYGVVPMQADWTKPNADIAAEVQRLGRQGIPLYVVYWPDGRHAVMPELITIENLKAQLAIR